MNKDHLEIFLFEDLGDIFKDVTIYPVYLPKEYKDYENLINTILGGEDSEKLSYKLTDLGADIKAIFPMIADVCLSEASRNGEKPWLYLTSKDISMDLLKFELGNVFKKATKNIIKSKSISLSDEEIETLTQEIIEGINNIEINNPLSTDEIVDNKRLIEAIIIHKITKLGPIPINLKVPATEEIITKELRFYAAYEQSKHVAISEWFTNDSSEKPRMHSFVLSVTRVNKAGKDVISINISRRTWIKESLPKKTSKNSSSLYHFSNNPFVKRTPIIYNKSTDKFTFKYKTDLTTFNSQHKNLDVDDILSNPSKFSYNKSNPYWWGVPFDVIKSDENVKRGVALIERQAFKRMFEDSLNFKPINPPDLIKKNSYIHISSGDISNLINYSGVDNLNLQIWGRKSTFETLCNLIEEDILKFTAKEKHPYTILDSTKVIDLMYFPSDAALKKPESKRARTIKEEKKKLFKESISNLIKIKNEEECSSVFIECKDEDENIVFSLYLHKENSTVCVFEGDQEIQEVVKKINPTIFTQAKIIERLANTCQIRYEFCNSKLDLLISNHDCSEFTGVMKKEDIVNRPSIIDECIKKEVTHNLQRSSAIIELENFQGKASDPKLLIRNAFAQKGIKTQFLVPKDKGIDHRLHACISDCLFKEGIFKRNIGIEDLEIYSYIEKTIDIDARNTYLAKDPDNKKKKLRVSIPILGKLSTNGLQFKVLGEQKVWDSTEGIYKSIDKYIANYISQPRQQGNKTRKCNLPKIFKDINYFRDLDKECIFLLSDLYAKDYGENEISSEYASYINNISSNNNISTICISSKNITPGYVTVSNKGRMGVIPGYAVLKDADNKLNDLGYIAPDKLSTTMKINLAKTIFDVEELYHQRNLIEIRRFGNIEIEKATEIYRELLKMVPAFVHMTSNDIIRHYFEKLTEYLDSVEYHYSSVFDDFDEE